jgi:hypothetical protein
MALDGRSLMQLDWQDANPLSFEQLDSWRDSAKAQAVGILLRCRLLASQVGEAFCEAMLLVLH